MRGYAVDSVGNLYPIGGADPVEPGRVWPNLDLMRAVSITGDSRGYVLDGWGGVFPFGGAPRLWRRAIWPGLDTARDLQVCEDERWGYLVDSRGGVHPLGDADRVKEHPRSDDANALALHLFDPIEPAGSVLFADGTVQCFGEAPSFPALEIPSEAVDFALLDGGPSGYILCSDGSVVGFGDAPALEYEAFPAKPIAIDILGSGGYVLYENGILSPLGAARSHPPVDSSARLVDLDLVPGQ